jgi:outer membrane protein assembly factor BamB
VIDWDAKKVVWAWGQGEVSGPHDAVVLPSGNFLLFDNGLGRGWSRIVELDPKTRKIVWEYRAPQQESFYSQTRGANQRLPNGNTLIAQSDSGRAFEVTRDGEIVWEFLNPNLSEGKRGALVRLRRIESGVVEGWLARDAASSGAARPSAAAH